MWKSASDGADEDSSDNDQPGEGVNSGDIIEAVRTIDQSSVADQLQSNDERGRGDISVDIGSRLNIWQKPVTEWGENPPGWKEELQRSPYIGNLDFEPKKWPRAQDTVNAVLDLMLKEIRNGAKKYEGLRIERYYKQGSSREGLKVIAPDEFDTVLQFHIEGYNRKLCISDKMERLFQNFANLKSKMASALVEYLLDIQG